MNVRQIAATDEMLTTIGQCCLACSKLPPWQHRLVHSLQTLKRCAALLQSRDYDREAQEMARYLVEFAERIRQLSRREE